MPPFSTNNMEPIRNKFVRFILLSNGIVDLFAALALFSPIFNIPLPGYDFYTSELVFIGGGWGIAALTFGIGRIWASYKPELYWIMTVLGLIEGIILSVFCMINILFLGVSFIQAILPLAIGSIYGILYVVAVIIYMRIKRIR